jgi:hypothetical protein
VITQGASGNGGQKQITFDIGGEDMVKLTPETASKVAFFGVEFIVT